NHANLDWCGRPGDERAIDRILRLQQFHAEEQEVAADPASDDRRMLPDSTREDQCVQSSERGREGPNPLSDLVTEDVDSQARPGIGRLERQQFLHVRTAPGDALQARLVRQEMLDLVDRELPESGET